LSIFSNFAEIMSFAKIVDRSLYREVRSASISKLINNTETELVPLCHFGLKIKANFLQPDASHVTNNFIARLV